MRILFVIPPEINKGRYVLKNNNIDSFLPLGIAQLSAVLKKQGHETKAVDLRVEKELTNVIKQFRSDIISVSGYFSSIASLQKLCGFIKSKFDTPIVLGGIHPSLHPVTIFDTDESVDYLLDDNLDFVITGEGEVVFPELLNRLKKKDFKKIKGLYFRNKNKWIKNKERPLVDNLDELPFPDFSLFDIKKYIPHPKHYKRTPAIPMSTSRGCTWGRCTFCWQSDLKGYYRKQSPKRVVAEIKHAVKEHGIREIRFWDDTFLHKHSWIKEFCDLMIKKKLDVIWSCHERVSVVTPEILNKMAKAGCWQILYGIESGHKDLLKSVDKGITLEQAKNAIKWTQEAGIEARASFILGLPNETPEMTDETIRFAKELDADVTQFCLMTPYPGTKMHDDVKKSEKLNKNLFNYTENQPVYIPKGYKNFKELEKKYKDAYKTIYLNPRYFVKTLKKIKSFEDVQRYYSGFKAMIGLSYGKRVYEI
ncbi:MAG: radical SAM protein [Nanoarchaeota archaeon]